MTERYTDLIMNPVRMKIVLCLLTGGKLNVQKIGEKISDIPQATLYRHLNKLLNAGVIEVVEENQIRGTVEKVYSLGVNVMQKTNEEFLSMTAEEQSRYFFTFLMGLMEEFGKYVGQEEKDMMKDGLMYRKIELYMNDDEFGEYLTEFTSLLSRYVKNEPSPGRKLRTFGTIIIPQLDARKTAKREGKRI